jgi:hypothetical protein
MRRIGEAKMEDNPHGIVVGREQSLLDTPTWAPFQLSPKKGASHAKVLALESSNPTVATALSQSPFVRSKSHPMLRELAVTSCGGWSSDVLDTKQMINRRI